ncbi:deoxyribose-phosphate aldolase [Sediminispirochaeta bajacaliforniensis]|uniref:deoxyribose-phosphate aldolase n=1 Tax=Sediminispirochaeta bajacaliforniensis TaxID=148 RepID=UPI0003775B55|nr:deoxyribose-phosphate aldolase [Sediminispirochaeta bajacaliforniensis]
MITTHDIAKMIDHSLLRPNLTTAQVREGLKLAKAYETVSVCVHPADVRLAVEILAGTEVKVTTVIGFPHGAHTTKVKLYEAEEAMADGAVELDMVINIGRLLSHDYAYVQEEIKALVAVAHAKHTLVKVILENCYLDDNLIKIACELSEAAGADFVKTSTGFGTGGATIHDLQIMRASCSPKVQIKAAGGVRTLDAALDVRAAGASRFGATATKTILDECRQREQAGTLKEK